MYGSLSTITHGDILTGRTWSLIFCAIKQKAKKQNKKKSLVSVCATLDTVITVCMYKVRFVLHFLFFFNDINMSMVVRRKKKTL